VVDLEIVVGALAEGLLAIRTEAGDPATNCSGDNDVLSVKWIWAMLFSLRRS
jgi:hypothetical protein